MARLARLVGVSWLVGVCMVLVAASAHAQDRASGVYVGAALGVSWNPELKGQIEDLENNVRLVNQSDLRLSVSVDDKAFAWSVYAGYALNESIAIEAGYFGTAKIRMKLNVSGTLAGESVRADADGEATRWSLYAAVVGHAPVDLPVKPFGKIGVRRWEVEVKASATSAGVPVSQEGKDDGIGLFLGVGVDVPIADAVSFRIEHLYLPLKDDDGGDEHLTLLGMHYSF